MDIFAVAAEASSILLTAIQLLQRAAKRRAELASKLEIYGAEVGETKTIIDLVRDEDALHTSGAIAAIRHVEALSQELKGHLVSMGAPRSGPRQFVHQIKSGSDDEEQLASIMVRLGRAKQDLILHVQVANVGLTKTVNNAIVVEMAMVNKIHVLLQDLLGEGKGLKIADFLRAKGNALEADRPLPLSDTECEELQREELHAVYPELADATLDAGGKRIIVQNLTRDQALQINGPVGVDMWKDMAFVKIEGNAAAGTAIQTNYPITIDVFKELLAARAAVPPSIPHLESSLK
ncbi:hypothetical protein GQ53DRAFT_764190 [Thozetella sp. PMI_491]|nr:hypothetical protein GQ53DRAFT_764190 [Thozetella sp. PMI_491]